MRPVRWASSESTEEPSARHGTTPVAITTWSSGAGPAGRDDVGGPGGGQQAELTCSYRYVTPNDVTVTRVIRAGTCDSRGRPAGGLFVIEELSRRTGMTVRSIRSYQSRKLLPPPEVRGRTGYYDERHVARIELIKDLQSEGLKLDSDRPDARQRRPLRRRPAALQPHGGRAVRRRPAARSPRSRTSRAALRRRRVRGAQRAGPRREARPRPVGRRRPTRSSPPASSTPASTPSTPSGSPPTRPSTSSSSCASTPTGSPASTWTCTSSASGRPSSTPGRPRTVGRRAGRPREVRNLATEALLAAFELVMAERVDETFGRELLRSPRTTGRSKHRDR